MSAPEPGFKLTSSFIRDRIGGHPASPTYKDEHGSWSKTWARDSAIRRMARDLGCDPVEQPEGIRMVCRICGPGVPHGMCGREKHDAYYEAMERIGGSR